MLYSFQIDTLKKIICALGILPAAYVSLAFFLEGSRTLTNEYTIAGFCIFYIVNLLSLLLVKDHNKKKFGFELRTIRTLCVFLISSLIFALFAFLLHTKAPNFFLNHYILECRESTLDDIILNTLFQYCLLSIPGWVIYYFLDTVFSHLMRIKGAASPSE